MNYRKLLEDEIKLCLSFSFDEAEDLINSIEENDANSLAAIYVMTEFFNRSMMTAKPLTYIKREEKKVDPDSISIAWLKALYSTLLIDDTKSKKAIISYFESIKSDDEEVLFFQEIELIKYIFDGSKEAKERLENLKKSALSLFGEDDYRYCLMLSYSYELISTFTEKDPAKELQALYKKAQSKLGKENPLIIWLLLAIINKTRDEKTRINALNEAYRVLSATKKAENPLFEYILMNLSQSEACNLEEKIDKYMDAVKDSPISLSSVLLFKSSFDIENEEKLLETSYAILKRETNIPPDLFISLAASLAEYYKRSGKEDKLRNYAFDLYEEMSKLYESQLDIYTFLTSSLSYMDEDIAVLLPLIKKNGQKELEYYITMYLSYQTDPVRYASKAYDLAVEIFGKESDNAYQAYLVLAEKYFNAGEEDKAIVMALSVLDAADKYKLNEIVKITSYNILGAVYKFNNDLDKALEYFSHALSYMEDETHKEASKADTLKHISEIYYAKKEYKKSLDFAKADLELETLLQDDQDIMNAINIIANCYLHLGEAEKALAPANSVYNLVLQMNGEEDVATLESLFLKTEAELASNRLKDALMDAKKIFKIVENSNEDEIKCYKRDAHIILANAYIKSGDKKRAEKLMDSYEE